jgi:hypothetical protein
MIKITTDDVKLYSDLIRRGLTRHGSGRAEARLCTVASDGVNEEMECCGRRNGGDPSYARFGEGVQRLEMDCCEKRHGGEARGPKTLNLFGPAPPEYKRPAELRCERVGSERRACLVNSVCLQVGPLVFA